MARISITGELGTGYAIPSGRVEIDDTLTVSGAAADAKATGERLEALEKAEAAQGLPRIYIDGEIPTTKTETKATLTYRHGDDVWKAYIKIKCQGRSSMEYPKKNFTVKLYEDADRQKKKKIAFALFGGQKQNKYVLKANWTDHTHARNVVVARLWSQIIESQPEYASLPEELRNSPNNGAVNGFPVLVYTNGTYQGIYTWNIGKDPWMLGMDEDNPGHALISGQVNTAGTNITETACNFRKLWDGEDNDWELEIGSDRTAIAESFNAVIACIKDAPDVEFKQRIADLLDVQSVIDYDLQMCQDHGGDNSANNLMMATYDLQKWRCVRYDNDGTYGMTGTGEQSMGLAQSEHLGSTYGEQNSLLWQRFEKCFAAEYKARGAALRESVLSFGNINANFENFMSAISADAYEDETTAYPTVPVGQEPRWQFRDWVRERLAYFDQWLEALPEYVLCSGISLSQQTLSFASASSQTLTATLAPSNCNDAVLWSSSDPNVAYVTGGVVTAVSDGEAIITASCGGQTAACRVTVEGVGSAEDALTYSLPSEATVSSLDSVITIAADDVPTVNENGSFTMLLDFTPTMDESQNNQIATQRSSWYNGGGKNGYLQLRSNTYYHDYILATVCGNSGDHPSYDDMNVRFNMDADSGKRVALAIRYDQGDTYHVKVDASDGETTSSNTGDAQFPALLGGGKGDFMVGGTYGDWQESEGKFGAATAYTPMTIHRVKMYSRYLSDEEIAEFFAGLKS